MPQDHPEGGRNRVHSTALLPLLLLPLLLLLPVLVLLVLVLLLLAVLLLRSPSQSWKVLRLFPHLCRHRREH